MKDELIKFETSQGPVFIRRVTINHTTMGLYEGVNQENIRENLDFQGHPFGMAALPILYHGLESEDLSETYCIWALLEGPPQDPLLSISSLAYCLITKAIQNPFKQLENILPSIDYWGTCKDFDL